MAGINKVILVGHVGKDPEVKYLEGGSALAKFTLATTESYKDKSGNKVENTEWHNITIWGKLAEIVEKYVKKGQLLYLEGKIKTRTVGEGDARKYFTDIVVNDMTMLGGKRDGNNSGSPAAASTMDNPAPSLASDQTDDLPF